MLVARLSPHQRLRREHAAYSSESLTLMDSYNYSGMFSLSEQDISELSRRLRVPKSILVSNAQRLRSICYALLAIYEAFRHLIYREDDHVYQIFDFDTEQMTVALEFFLQMDSMSISRETILDLVFYFIF